MATPIPELNAQLPAAGDAKQLTGATTLDHAMSERQAAASSTISETTPQAPATRTLVSIIMCCAHLLNIVQLLNIAHAVPLRETKVFLLPHESLG